LSLTRALARPCSAALQIVRNRKMLWIAAIAGTAPLVAYNMAPSATDTPVSIIVSVEAKHGKEIPAVYREDVKVFQGHDRVSVADWVPLQQEQAGLDLLLLIDDATDSGVGLQFDDLQKFINQQPPATKIAVGYIRFGAVDIAQNFTSDHSLAAKALRLPIGSGMASPYIALTDMMRGWPETTNRREIFLMSSGIDALQPGPSNTYLEQAIAQAQRRGIQISAIYAGRNGHLGRTLSQLNWGQNNLSQLADETGGEAYFQALQMPLSFGPYLDDFASRLTHQFKLTFLAKSGNEPGLKRIRLQTEVPNAELVAAEKVYVPAVK
jgi:hypothetical protein